jgi:hypothetical protein
MAANANTKSHATSADTPGETSAMIVENDDASL